MIDYNLANVVINLRYERKGLSGTDRDVYLYLLAHADERGRCDLGRATLAIALDMHESHVRRAEKRLAEKRLVDLVDRWGGRQVRIRRVPDLVLRGRTTQPSGVPILVRPEETKEGSI